MGPSEVRPHFPYISDLVAVVIAGTGGALLAAIDVQGVLPLRFVFGVFLALFAPGYALLAVLFPDKTEIAPAAPPIVTRVTLSVAMSAVILPLAVLGLQYTGVGIRRVPVALTLLGVTVVLTFVAGIRRYRLPPESRYTPPSLSVDRESVASAISDLTIVDKVLYGLLIVALLVTVAGAGYALINPVQDGTTEFYLLAENRTGDLSASDYPTELVVDQSSSVVVGIENDEGQSETYTVVVQLQRVSERTSNPQVINTTGVSRFTTRLDAGETTEREVAITPRVSGTNQRLLFELYRGETAGDQSYRELYLWVNVTAPNAG